MKKALLILLFFALLSTALISCDKLIEPYTESKQNTEQATESPPQLETTSEETESLTSSEKTTDLITENTEETNQEETTSAETTTEETDIYKIAEKAIINKFGSIELSAFESSHYTQKDGSIVVQFDLYFGNIHTYEEYTVYLTHNLKVTKISSDYAGVYSRFIGDESFLQSLEAAKAKIIDQALAEYGLELTGDFWFEENDGCIYIIHEVIIDIDPPNYETDHNGEIIENGCGIDHEHIFLKERVYKIS